MEPGWPGAVSLPTRRTSGGLWSIQIRPFPIDCFGSTPVPERDREELEIRLEVREVDDVAIGHQPTAACPNVGRADLEYCIPAGLCLDEFQRYGAWPRVGRAACPIGHVTRQTHNRNA